jgi:hypothetical protein
VGVKSEKVVVESDAVKKTRRSTGNDEQEVRGCIDRALTNTATAAMLLLLMLMPLKKRGDRLGMTSDGRSGRDREQRGKVSTSLS